MVDNQVMTLINDFPTSLQYQGMNLDMYLQYTGMTLDAMKENYKEQAKKEVEGGLVLGAIARAEGVGVSPEELGLELVDMAKKYNMELDKLKELLSDAETENIKRGLAVQKTVTMLVNNAVVK